jgi:FlaA1/EpsC-like NDP-sugar epimerase
VRPSLRASFDRLVAGRPLRSALQVLVGLGRYTKRGILIIHDGAILSFVVWIAFSLRYGELFIPPNWTMVALMGLAPLITGITLFQFGVYRIVTRYMGGRSINLIALSVCLSTLIWALVILLSGEQGVPRVALLIYPVGGTVGLWGGRQVGGWLLKSVGMPVAGLPGHIRLPVIIYGAGTAGLMLAQSLERSERFVPFGFVDRNPTLWGQYIGGYKVFRPDRLAGMVEKHSITEVMVALSHEGRQERATVLRELAALSVPVRTLPAFDDIALGRVTISDLRPIDATDLLGRDPVPPNTELIARNVAGKTVMVTGAGGSIGSELVRQIVRQRPKCLVLFEMSENALYQIEAEIVGLLAKMELESSAPVPGPGRPSALQSPSKTTIVAVLGSVLNKSLVSETLRVNAVQTIYHAAAYKHVPIIERNAVLGLDNNTFGTARIAAAAAAHGVERFVLVSTDKAVRPTNVMGASKRLAEIILQVMSANGTSQTVFTMVRFGNVLDSSGSVVRRFRQQIEAGGPVTVTHPEMIRYFMSIPEAASLVIQAAAMAKGGEVFVLDMGEPVKIDDLARSMIRLSGLEVRDANNPDGEILIEYIGLRPGEKMREELLIGSNTSSTEHPRIQTTREPSLSSERLEIELAALRAAMMVGNLEGITTVLKRAVEGYTADTPNHAVRPIATDGVDRGAAQG